MKFYYVALTINPEQPVKTHSGKRLAYYTNKHQVIKQRDYWNAIYRGFNSHKKEKAPYKVYCVESEPEEIE